MRKLYWLDDASFAKIEPHLPKGRRGARRQDDRRIISGIIHMLRCGAPWRTCPAEYGPATTIYNRYHRWSQQGVWQHVFEALTGASGIYGTAAIDATHVKAHRFASGAKGDFAQAIGRSRGGRTTKVHALTDAEGRPRVLLLSPGNVNDLAMAIPLLSRAGPVGCVVADRAYDANSLRQFLAEQGTAAVIPSTASRRHPIPYDRGAYRQRNLIERMFGRLKDWRRIATRYDKLADNYLAAIHLAAIVTWWAN